MAVAVVALAAACEPRPDRVWVDDAPDTGGDAPIAPPDAPPSLLDADVPASDAGPTDAEADAHDADAAIPDDSGDGGHCAATNTVTDCSGCGLRCSVLTASAAACNGATCLYTCMANRQNCSTTAPDLDGCECEGTGCCAARCQTAHSNGVGQTFYDCHPLETYTQAQAKAACTAATGDSSQCTAFACAGNAGSVVCSSGPGCTCWKYSAGNSGVNGKVSTTCGCPTDPAAPSWN